MSTPPASRAPTGSAVGAAFVGRHMETQRLHELLAGVGPRILFLHGLAGSGKTALIHQFARISPRNDQLVIVMDCRDIEPTEHGFRTAVAESLGQPRWPGGDLAALMTRMAGARQVLLCLDNYEVFRLLDTWLRQDFVPVLPANVSLLIAGRQEPNPAWFRQPSGSFQVMRAAPLSRAESTELVHTLGLSGDKAQAIIRFAGGHPLTLLLGSLAAKEGAAALRDVTLDRLLDVFTAAYLGDLNSETRRVLEMASVVRRVTVPLITAIEPEADSRAAFERLRELPFIEMSHDGLAVHSTVQECIARGVWAADPARHREMRRRAWAYLRDQLRTLPRAELWRHTADMIYLLENRSVREAHFPSNAHTYAVEAATPGDEDAILAIIARHEPEDAARLLKAWWDASQGSFRVARDSGGGVAGFSILMSGSGEMIRRLSDDPVVMAWSAHLRAVPMPADGKSLFLRRWLTWADGDAPSAAQAALWLDLKRQYMELRPELRRIYSTTDHPGSYGPVLTSLEATELPEGRVEIGGRWYTCYCLDFGPSSVDGWLTRVAARELGIDDDGLLDIRQRQLRVNGRRVDLTPKEFEVISYLSARAGEPVTRADLLESVWGYDGVIGSNVVDAVVVGLRKKLGSRAEQLQTVRGVGYRIAEL